MFLEGFVGLHDQYLANWGCRCQTPLQYYIYIYIYNVYIYIHNVYIYIYLFIYLFISLFCCCDQFQGQRDQLTMGSHDYRLFSQTKNMLKRSSPCRLPFGLVLHQTIQGLGLRVLQIIMHYAHASEERTQSSSALKAMVNSAVS